VKHKILVPPILLILLVSSSLVANASEPETITPLADTYVNGWNPNSVYGHNDSLEVSDYTSGLCIASLMFDLSQVSHVLNASSEVKLRLYCFSVADPHIVGVHWCVNNTWSEENLTFTLFGGFFRTAPESVVKITNSPEWYEWKVTDFVHKAVEENYEKITLTLEVEDPLEGTAASLYTSKDQKIQEWLKYSPQLVFTYLEPNANSMDTIIKVTLGLTVSVVIAFLTYKLSKRRTRKKRHQQHSRT